MNPNIVPIIIIAALVLLSGTAFAMTSNNDVEEAPDEEGGDVRTVDKNWNKFDDDFLTWANCYSIPARWLKGICLNESSLGTNPRVVQGIASEDGLSYGIMQITLATAADLADKLVTPEELNDPTFSIRYAALYLSRLKTTFNNIEENVIRAYNEGPGKRKKVLAGLATSSQINIDYWARYQRWQTYITQKGGLVS